MSLVTEEKAHEDASRNIVSILLLSLWRGLFLFRVFMTDFIQSRKSKILIILGLLPVAFVLATGVGLYDPNPTGFYIDTLRTLHITLIVPLFGLLFGTAAITDEIESHTMVQLVTRPVRRVEILIWRYIATIVMGMLTSSIIIGGYFVLFASQIQDLTVLGGSLLLAFVCVSVYSAIFTLLGIAIKKALLWGSILVLYEQGLGVLIMFFAGPAISLSSYIQHVGTTFLNYSVPLGVTWTVDVSYLVLLILLSASLVLASILFKLKDLS